MVTVRREMRRAYEPCDGADIPSLASLPGVDAVRPSAQQVLDAMYFDDADRDLAAAGITLCRVSGGDDAGWRLRLPTGEDETDLLRMPLGRAYRTAPKALRDLLRLHLRNRPVTVVATVRTRRTVHSLLDGDERLLAVVCDDRIEAPEPSPAEAAVPRSRREWSVAVGDGGHDLFRAADALLRSTGATTVRPSPAGAPEPGTGPAEPRRDGPASATVLARLCDQVAGLKRRDPQVRCDLDDAVHQMRVSMRRLRCALATFRPLLDRDVTKPLRAELKWIAAVLGEARDAEVMHERLRTLMAREPTDLVMGGAGRRIDDDLGEAHRTAHARSLEAMSSQRYFALVDALDSLLADPPWTPKAERLAGDVLPTRVRDDWRRLRDRVAAAEQAGDRRQRDARLHDARKAAKRARYAAEALQPLYGPDAERLVRAARRVQSVLGDHQDSVVTQEVLRRLGVQAHLDGDSAFTFGLLHAREQARAAETEALFAKTWAKSSRKRLRRWLA